LFDGRACRFGNLSEAQTTEALGFGEPSDLSNRVNFVEGGRELYREMDIATKLKWGDSSKPEAISTEIEYDPAVIVVEVKIGEGTQRLARVCSPVLKSGRVAFGNRKIGHWPMFRANSSQPKASPFYSHFKKAHKS